MATAWGYGKSDGPSTWATQFPAAAGAEQSPIKFKTSDAQFSTALSNSPLVISYQPEQALKLINTGASIKADCSQKASTLTGGPLGQKVYRLAQFHLHWGAKDDRGAEHVINDKVYAAELHLVHWNSTDYASFDKAVDQKDGLAVLCVFIDVGGSGHQGFEAVSSQLDKTTCKGDNYTLTSTFDPTCLLPSNTHHFWTYHGSLTTPPCFESVQFILFEDPVQFSKEQMAALRSLHVGDQKSEHMVDNFRPTCTLGERCVLASFTK